MFLFVKIANYLSSASNNLLIINPALKNLTQEAPAPSETPTVPSTRATGTNQLASSLTSISNYAFAGTGLESIDLSLTGITDSLGNSAFENAVSLNDVKLPSGLIAIPAASFAGTTALKSIAIPKTINRINAGNSTFLGAFQGSGLESIDLSETKITGGSVADQPGS